MLTEFGIHCLGCRGAWTENSAPNCEVGKSEPGEPSKPEISISRLTDICRSELLSSMSEEK